MKLNYLIAGALVGALPLAASAATVEMRVNGGEVVVEDNGTGDNNGIEGLLNATVGPVSGYESVAVNVTRFEAPPYDQLQADVDVVNTEGGPAEILVEVTGHFMNNQKAIWPGQFTATANDVLGSSWTITSYVGSSSYDRAMMGVTGSGSLFAVSNLIRFNPNDYWITHVFEHAADRDGVSASGNADFVAPVPVPAAGFLLLGALGGLVAAKRRKG